MLPPCGTFLYSGAVPDDWPRTKSWTMEDRSGAPRDDLPGTHDHNRLVGLLPILDVDGSTLTLTATDRPRAQVAQGSLRLDDGFISALQPRDILHMVRTEDADIGISLLRGDRLIAACGAADVTLGHGVTLVGGSGWNEILSKYDYWLEFAIDGTTSRLRKGDRETIGGYTISVLHFQSCRCVAISLDAVCNHTAVVRASEVIAGENASLEIIKWSRRQ